MTADGLGLYKPLKVASTNIRISEEKLAEFERRCLRENVEKTWPLFSNVNEGPVIGCTCSSTNGVNISLLKSSPVL
jgi:hypothetical protein